MPERKVPLRLLSLIELPVTRKEYAHKGNTGNCSSLFNINRAT